MSTMWKSNPIETSSTNHAPESSRTVPAFLSTAHPAPAPSAPSCIGKGLIITGEITGTEPLLVEGTFDGKINLPDNRVTIGRNGHVTASITARDVKVMGTVCGDVAASNLLEVCAEGAVTGDVTAARLRIDEGAYFKGGVETRRAENMQAAQTSTAMDAAHPQKPTRLVRPEVEGMRMHSLAQSA
jgi:cytoskeletal protein CcmA (bactofilin family)